MLLPVAAARPSSPRRRRWLIALAIVAGTLPLIAFFGCAHWARQAIVAAPNAERRIDPADDADEALLRRLGILRQLRVDTGEPGVSLLVWVIEASDLDGKPATPRGTLLFLHGIWASKEIFLETARSHAQHGYRAVALDLRGHGRSPAKWITYGAKEGEDIRRVIDALERENLVAGRIGVYGVSYGGAVAIQAAAADPRIVAVVAVAPFSSLREVVPAYARSLDPLGIVFPDPWVQQRITEAGALAGFDPNAADTVAAIRRTSAAVLLFHGRLDEKIPWTHSRKLHDAAPDRSKLVIVEGAFHDSINLDVTGVLWKETTAWFDRHVAR